MATAAIIFLAFTFGLNLEDQKDIVNETNKVEQSK